MISPEYDFFNSHSHAEARDAVDKAFAEINDLINNNYGIRIALNSLGSIKVSLGDAHTLYDLTNNILRVDDSSIKGRINDTFDPGLGGELGSFTRTIFHELIHEVTVPDQLTFYGYQSPLNPYVNFSEAVAIFAENLLYAYPTNEKSRAGHGTWWGPTGITNGTTPEGGGLSGVSAFDWVRPMSTVGPWLADSNDGATFRITSDDGKIGVEKKYTLGGEFRPEVTARNDNGFLSYSGDTIGWGLGAKDVIDSLMGARADAVITSIRIATATIVNFGAIIGEHFNQTAITGISGERYYTREFTDETQKTTMMYDFIGLGSKEFDDQRNPSAPHSPASIAVNAEHNGAGTVVVGAAGYSYSTGSTDDLIGGIGNDVLVSAAVRGGNKIDGGGGNDLIIGSGHAGDVLSGGSGDDLFIARGTGTQYDGGGSAGDVLSYYAMSSKISADTGVQKVSHDGSQDAYGGIGVLIGSQYDDTFVLGGAIDIYGGAGSDTFIGLPIGKIDGGSGFDTLDLRQTGGGTVHLDNGLINGIDQVLGSSGSDYILGGMLAGSSSTPSIYGNGGDDIIEAKGTINIYAGSGNDTVRILSEGYGALDGGSDHDILDFSAAQGSRLILHLNGTSGDYQIDTGGVHRFTNFEEFWFGTMSLYVTGATNITGSPAYNSIYGTSGTDDITVGGTGGFVYAGGGDDKIHSSGREVVYGDDGNDELWAGNTVSAHLNGGYNPANYTAGVADGDDILHGGSQIDYLSAGSGSNTMFGGGGYDYFSSDGWGDNEVHGEGDGGKMSYGFSYQPTQPNVPALKSIHYMDSYYEVVTSPDRGQTLHTDHLYDINVVGFSDNVEFQLTPTISYDSPWM